MLRATIWGYAPHERLHPSALLLLAVRVTVAAVWLYEGLWLKVLLQAPHELAVVESLPRVLPFAPAGLLALIGWGETLLALGVLSGLFFRPLAWFQAALLVAMQTMGIIFAGGAAIDQPLGLVVHNLPFLTCISLIGTLGPGPYSVRLGFWRK